MHFEGVWGYFTRSKLKNEISVVEIEIFDTSNAKGPLKGRKSSAASFAIANHNF